MGCNPWGRKKSDMTEGLSMHTHVGRGIFQRYGILPSLYSHPRETSHPVSLPLYKAVPCHSLEKEMATHSSTLAWKIPWMEEPSRLQSMGCKELDTTEQLHFTHFILYHWRRKWQPTPVFLPGESHGQRSLAGRGPRGLRESDTTDVTKHARTCHSHPLTRQ